MRSNELMAALFERAREAADYEEKRYEWLSARATSLLGASGLAMTVTTTFAAWLFRVGTAAEKGEPPPVPWVALLLAGIAALVGLAAAIQATRALKVSTYKRPAGTALFDAKQVADADAKKGEGAAVAEYQQWLTPHYWEVAAMNGEANDAKATMVEDGQVVFAVFIALVASIAITLLATM